MGSLTAIWQHQGLRVPRAHLVLGSVLAGAWPPNGPQDSKACASPTAPRWELKLELPFAEVDGLVPATAPGHKGRYLVYQNSETRATVSVQVGRLHGYEGHSAETAVAPVQFMRELGVEHFVLTNAAGSLQRHHRQGSAMIIRDHVNLTGRNPLIRPIASGPRFPDMMAAYDAQSSDELKCVLLAESLQVSEGVYLGILGPSFETPAEVRLFSKWGLDAVGFSTVWETIQLRQMGATVVGVSLISNMGCGLESDRPLDHFQFENECQQAAAYLARGLWNYLIKV